MSPEARLPEKARIKIITIMIILVIIIIIILNVLITCNNTNEHFVLGSVDCFF